MRRRFFVDEVRNGHAEIADEDARHLTRVLRVEPGQRYEISDNQRVYLAEIESARKDRVIFRTLQSVETQPLPVHLILCAALIKFDHFEWMIEKATELGVAEIVPVETIRSERGLERAAPKRLERWRRILLEASQQSRRAQLPKIDEPIPFREVLLRGDVHRFALDEDTAAPPMLGALPDRRIHGESVALLAGPEGGWVDEERAAFSEAGWSPVSLGPLILRAETAALAGLALVSAAWLQTRVA